MQENVIAGDEAILAPPAPPRLRRRFSSAGAGLRELLLVTTLYVGYTFSRRLASDDKDAAIHRAWTVSLGRRDAIARVAHLFCELQVRLGIVGLADEHGYALPITQAVLAECLGLTSVHVNRVLKELRERNLVEFRGGRVSILDRDGLAEIGEFDPAYLYLDRKNEI